MSDVCVRKQRTYHAGSVSLTVSMPPQVAEMLLESKVYQRIVGPARARLRSRRPPDTRTGSSPRLAPLDEEGRRLLARIDEVDWYHTIDLGHGVVTPGLVDHRAQLPFYGLPASLEGKRVLDVATFDGFWAFEFERRGAEVIALDLPCWADVDMPQPLRPYAAEFDLDRRTGAAFAIAHDILGSSVRRVEGNVYDLDPNVIGTFDLVFVSDLLLHLRCPERALEAAASVCRGQLVIADVYTPMLEGFGDLALAQYNAPSHTWWVGNVKTLQMMMHVAGCESIEEVSRFLLDWRIDDPMHKVVLRGTVNRDPAWLRASREWAGTVAPKWRSAEEQGA
jgi:tRNA (mo5U34)-methyltransferase